jgi:hypothetical protein
MAKRRGRAGSSSGRRRGGRGGALLLLVLALALLACASKKRGASVDAGPSTEPAPGRDAGAGDGGAGANGPAPPGADDAPADRALCERALAHMMGVAPELVRGDELDLGECQKLPTALVRCLLAIRDAAGAEACVDGELVRKGQAPRGGEGGGSIAADGGPGADARPGEGAAADSAPASRAECEQVVEHYLGLLPATARDEWPKASMLATCPHEVRRAEAKCVLAAKTLADADRCLDE